MSPDEILPPRAAFSPRMSKLPALGDVDYASPTPPIPYHCGRCRAHGVKLWREYAERDDGAPSPLRCADCACSEQSRDGRIYRATPREDGTGEVRVRTIGLSTDDRRSEDIGRCVPAIPIPGGIGFSRYLCAPLGGEDWWHRLPLRRGG